MKTPPEDHDLIRWLDGEMNEAERARFTTRLEAEPELKAEAEAMQALSANLRAHLPASLAVPHADFFNSQIQVRISQMELEESRASQRATTDTAVSWWQYVRLPWLATAAAAIALVAMVLRQPGNPGMAPLGESLVLSSYAPNTEVTPRVFHSNEAEATVLMLDGIQSIPPDRKLVGYHIERSEADQDVATTTLYGQNDHVVLVLATDSRNQPRILEANPRG